MQQEKDQRVKTEWVTLIYSIYSIRKIRCSSYLIATILLIHKCHEDLVMKIFQGAWWHSGRASDSESRGPGFDPHRRHRVMSLSKTH